ncbi:MAG TPA: hypothetical protein PK835_08445, partial [Caldisericia bacterium]|nr:hypothetical protein [Caldisericia bacterium]
ATANARLEVAEYVTRQKLSETDRQAYDQAKALGSEYERLRKAGVSEIELQEWLKYKTIESTKGMNAEQLASFNKFWDERKAGAELAVAAEKKAWDEQINNTKKQIQEQQELVDQLKQKAQDAVNIMRELLGMAPLITGEGKVSAGSEDIISGIDISKLPDEQKRLLEQLIGGKLPGYLPPGLPKIPGKDTDSWIGRSKYPTFGSTETSTGESAKDLVIPPGTTTQDMAQISTQTREELQARIDTYTALKSTAIAVETELQKSAKTTIEEIIKIFKEGKPDPNKDFGKEFVDAFKQEGKDAFTGLAKPIKNGMEDLIREMPGYGQRLSNMLARGLQDAEGFLDRAVLEHVVKIIQKYLESHSPPKEGPLKTIDKWPAGLIGAFASGFSYNNVQYAINQAATQFANTFDKSVKAKSSTWWQSVFVPTGSQGLLWGEGTKDNSWQYEAFRQQLLKPTPVKEAYENRVKLLAGKDEGLSAFTQVRTYNKEQQQRQELLAKVGSYDKQRYENFFNQWYDQSLMVGDLGKITLNDIKTFVSLHPDRAKMPAWHDRIVKANPDLYYEAIGRKILPLAAIPEGWSNKTRALDGRIMYEGGGRVSQTTQRTSSVFDITNAGGIVKASEGGYDWKEGWDFAPSQWGNLSTGKHWVLDDKGNKVFTDTVLPTTSKKEFKDSPFAQGFDAGTAINKFQWQEEKTWTGAKGFNEWLQEKFDTWRKTTQGSKG